MTSLKWSILLLLTREETFQTFDYCEHTHCHVRIQVLAMVAQQTGDFVAVHSCLWRTQDQAS